MRLKWLWLAAVLAVLWSAAPAWAETVHLTSGEVIKGKIVQADADTISVQTEQGFGTVHIKRSDITLIEFDHPRDATHLFGVGYYHRATPSSIGAQAAEYGVDALSFKMWLNDVDWVDLLTGFYDNTDSTGTVFKVFSLDLRLAHVFHRQNNLDAYYGGSLGLLNVTDNTVNRDVHNTGYSARAFIGIEVFPASLPNLGISSELGVGTQNVGSSRTTDLSATTFPTFSVRYYF